MGARWYLRPMKVVIDGAGRLVVPKPLRDALGLVPGSTVELTRYGAGLSVVPTGRTAQIVQEDGVRVVGGTTPLDDEVLFALLDDGRR